MKRSLLLVLTILYSFPSYAATPFCIRDAKGEDKLHFDALFDSAAQNPALVQEFSPSSLQGIFQRISHLAKHDEVFMQKLKDTWCKGPNSQVVVQDLFVTDSNKKMVREDLEQVSMHIHLLASLANGEKLAEFTLRGNQSISHDVHGDHLLSDEFELESFK